MPFTSNEAKELNKSVFEAIYFFALEKSCIIARETGAYRTFNGSPLSEGKFQFDLWNVQPSNNWNWESLRINIKKIRSKEFIINCINAYSKY